MMKVCVLFLLAALPALPQFGDARSLQHQPIKPGMTCASDAYVLTWVAAHGQFECLAASGAPTGAAGGVLGGTYPSPTFAGGASFNANAATFLNGAGSFTSPGTANGTCALAAAATCSITLTGVAAKAVWSCYDNSGTNPLIPNDFVITTDTLTFNFSAPATGYCNASTGIGLTGATGPTGPAGGVTSVFGSTGVITTLANPAFTGTMTVGTSLRVGYRQVIPPAYFSGGANLNDLSITGSVYTGTAGDVQYDIKLSTAGTPDKFQWRIDSGAYSAEIAITGASQSLSDGIAIQFAATTGHTLNNHWYLGVASCIANGNASLAHCLTNYDWPNIPSPDYVLVEPQGFNDTPGMWERANGGIFKSFLSLGGTGFEFVLAGGTSLYDIAAGTSGAIATRKFAYRGNNGFASQGNQVAFETVQLASGSVVADLKGQVDWDLGGSKHFNIDGNTGLMGWGSVNYPSTNGTGALTNDGSGNLSWVASGANRALSNLSSVSINAGLIPQTTLSLGAQATPWQNLYIYGQGTFGSHSIKFDGTPTGNRVITFPDATATVATLDGSQALTNKTYNGNTFTAGTGVLTIAAAKTLTANSTLTLAGTDGITMTTPTTSFTAARTDAANTFTGTQTIGALVATTVNGNTFTTGTGVLTIAAAKTLTASNTLTLAGTDSTTMTFPTTSATIARTDAANTFTGHQTIEGVTSTGATGTGNLVFSAGPTFTGTLTAATISGSSVTSSGSVSAGAGQSIQFTSSTRLQAPSSGIALLTNSGAADFTRLDFGVTGATGPALTTTIQTNPILAVTDATGGKTAVLLPSNFATVSVLPSCATAAFKGAIANVLDASAPTIGSTVAGGAAAFAQVVCNGTNWTVTGI